MDTEEVWRPYQYSDADGCGYAALVKQYKDPRMEMLGKLHREDELVQAAHRIRPVLTEGKSIYLLTALPVEELAPSRLITVNELAEELGGMPDARDGITFKLVESIARDMMAETDTGVVWFDRLKTLIMTHVSQDGYKENIYGEGENPQCLQGFPSDSTLYRWLQKLAQQNGWSYSRVTVERNQRGGGATWIGVYHMEGFDEEFVRTNYAKVWDIEPEDEVFIEPLAVERAEDGIWEVPDVGDVSKDVVGWYPLRE